jgi:hypothetical protein
LPRLHRSSWVQKICAAPCFWQPAQPAKTQIRQRKDSRARTQAHAQTHTDTETHAFFAELANYLLVSPHIPMPQLHPPSRFPAGPWPEVSGKLIAGMASTGWAFLFTVFATHADTEYKEPVFFLLPRNTVSSSASAFFANKAKRNGPPWGSFPAIKVPSLLSHSNSYHTLFRE